MRKTLLIAAAALAVGVINSQAQGPVYSQNIVGYVNSPLLPGYNLIANPLNAGVSNGVNEVFANINDGDTFLFFNGVGYDQVEYSPFLADNVYTLPTPWFDPNNPTVSVPIPKVIPGQGFYYYNSAASNTVTLVGQVKPAPGTTNVVGLTAGYNMVGSALAVGGSVTNAAFNLIPNDGDTYLTFNGVGYDQVEYSPFLADNVYSLPTPWFDPNNPTVSVAPPSIKVGQAFFFYNSASTNSWVQSLPSN